MTEGVMPEQDVGAAAELADGALHEAEIDGQKILLTQTSDGLRAVGGTCPHAGAPLIQGVRFKDRILCPWHKAAFCLRTGDLLEPPAVDPLPSYPVRVHLGRVLVGQPTEASAEPERVSGTRRFVIVGAGAAGASAAQTLRERGFDGEIVMLDDENRVPYDRTVLSKYVLSGESGGEKTPLQTQAFYETHAIARRTATVTNIDTQARQLACADGSVLRYDAVLLATGGAPSLPNIPGAHLRNVFLLRSLADAQTILAQAERSRKVVVLGTGFIGMEVAASLRERGLDVTVVGKESAPFIKQLGAEVGGAFVGLHERKGVAFRLGRGVSALRGDQAVQSVILDDGEELPADLVVIGFGVHPSTNFAEGLRRAEDGGIIVDACLRAAPDVYAAGDIARFPLRGKDDPIRVEHWRVALQHGRIAAVNMLGDSKPYDAVPVFWTIQYLKRLDYIGHADTWDETIIHGDLEKPDFLVYYVKNGRVAAAAAFDRDKDAAALIELLQLRDDWTAAALGAQPAGILAAIRS
jgi:apoptosis-inducing factor 3